IVHRADEGVGATQKQPYGIDRRIAAAERSTSSSLVAQFETEMRVAAMLCQVVPASQSVPSRWTRATVSRVASSLPLNRTRTWLTTTSFRISRSEEHTSELQSRFG